MSILIKGIDLPKDRLLSIDIYPDGSIFTGIPIPRNQVQAEAIQIDKPWKECSCYQCKHRGTAPYEKPCSVCARNHKDYFEEI